MRIISKFQDYYDSALAFGHDEHVVFERTETGVQMFERTERGSPEYKFMIPSLGARTSRNRWWQPTTNRNKYDFGYYPFTIAFCGKLYRGIELRYQRYNQFDNWVSDYFYDAESYAEQIRRYGLPYREKSSKTYAWDKNPKGSPTCKEDVEKYFLAPPNDHMAFFAERRHPIVVCRYQTHETGLDVIFNAKLADYKFYRVFDAYTAFQELDMFISGVMSREGNLMADICDTDMRDKKGFDKMSFKKPPTKKR